ncbi:hypothetical protein BA011_01615 [Rhizobium leguminosarum]|uniref:Propionyl-coenzyme A carboxylase alpha polypeptide n=1 Tax=Rhizobium leguminosarum TaxID=384 RepID=A0A1B1C443_RHILE|nr:hypothetical protein BA011_01615 [Rhizobium leguminosarum]
MAAPSALPGISPTGGEITSGLNFLPIYRFAVLNADCLRKRSAQPISPPVGEMPARAEGGAPLRIN